MRRSRRNKKKAGSHEEFAMKLLEELRQQCYDKEIEVYFDDSIIDLQKKLDEANEMGSPSSATFGPDDEVFGGELTPRLEEVASHLELLLQAAGGGYLSPAAAPVRVPIPPPPRIIPGDAGGDDPAPVGGPPPPSRTAAAVGRERHYQGSGAPPSEAGLYPHPPGWSGLGGRLSAE
jgi:hypothetical protein